MAEPDGVEILLVEDGDEDAELTARALRKSRIANQLRRVRDGAEALELLLGGPAHAGAAAAIRPRLVLLDLKLPKVSGLEVLARLKATAHAAIPWSRFRARSRTWSRTASA
jgi:CheY-like chemotaxis protein